MRKEIASLQICHNIEVAHRLTKTPGKCLQVHGHSMWVEMEMWGDIDDNGLVGGLEFGALKLKFRHMLDTDFDHRCLLNHQDPLVLKCEQAGIELPGLSKCIEDPTTENLARWIGQWGVEYLASGLHRVKCTVHETRVNIASWEWEG